MTTQEINNLINWLNEIVDKEQKHYDMLLNVNAPMQLISSSKMWLDYYKEKLEEYTKYFKK